MGAISPGILLDFLKREKLTRSAEASLLSFAEQAWEIIEPTAKFEKNWHLEAIAEHLEAVSAGEIQNLLVNMPPGCCKSILVSVIWPAWDWLLDPSLRILGASYGEDLAVRDARKTRDIITSDWYQDRWPHVKLVKGDDQKTKYSLTARGWRMATSVGGRATGEHPDRKIVDDPHSAKQAASDAERTTGVTWFNSTLSTRGVARGASTVVVMQRLHEQDISGFILDNFTDYEHLCLPMRYEKELAKPKTKLGFVDPRTTEGSLLWPQLFPEEKIKKMETALGEYGTAGQLQQRPAPTGGGILKSKGLQLWPAGKELPEFDFVVQSWDTAYTEATTGDPSALTVWGTAKHEGKQIAVLLDCFTDNLAYPKLKLKVIEEWGSRYGKDDRHADTTLVEQKSSGHSIIQDLRQAGIPVRAYNPGKADKVVRAHTVAPLIDAQIIYIPESTREPSKFVSWARPLIKEMEVFPNGAHDDMVDTLTQALIYLKDAGFIASGEGYEEDKIEEYADDKVLKTNPYAA
jgi:predicted phage terminase large subunit-like protein